MQKFDVVVVGAGPAGGHCARLLAQRGYRVLLLEKSATFEHNSFSSAGVPLQTIAQYGLPADAIGSYWNRLVIVTSNKTGAWTAEQPQGCVLDFTKLRQFLACETEQHGGRVWMGCRYVSHAIDGGSVAVTVRDAIAKTTQTLRTRLLVDATGAARSITRRLGTQTPLVQGTGLEYLVKVDSDTYRRSAQALTFLLGHKWIPGGYAWVFPMEEQYLKVGAGTLRQQHKIVAKTESLSVYVERLINDYVRPKTLKVIDVHGGTLQYSLGLQDTYWGRGVVAIGDTVSTVNFLGGEGIRHAMLSAEIVQKHIARFLESDAASFDSGFDSYRAEMHSVFLSQWKASEKLGLKKYVKDSENLVDRVVSYLEPMRLEDIVDILFYYRFEKISKGLWRYLYIKITSRFAAVIRLGAAMRRSDGRTPV